MGVMDVSKYIMIVNNLLRDKHNTLYNVVNIFYR
jgi:hypothetical protein